MAKWYEVLGKLGCEVLSITAPPFGGMAADAVKKVFNLGEDATDSDISKAIEKATPEQVSKILKADADLKIRLKEMDVDIEKIHQKDRSDARSMQEKTKSWTPPILAAFVTLGFFGTLFFLVQNTLPDGSSKDAILIMIGALGTEFGRVMNFYFGSSKGSSDKTAMLNDRK